MVAVQSRLDDVLLALKNKKVEATHTVRRTIPSMCTPDGKSKRITLDVSDEGERELDKLDKKFTDTLLDAGRVYGKLSDTRAEARAAKPRRKPQSEAASQDAEESVEDAGEDVEDEDGAQESEPAAGNSFAS